MFSSTGPALVPYSSRTGPALVAYSSSTGPELVPCSSSTGPALVPYSCSTGPVLVPYSSSTGPLKPQSQSAVALCVSLRCPQYEMPTGASHRPDAVSPVGRSGERIASNDRVGVSNGEGLNLVRWLWFRQSILGSAP